MLDRTSDSPAKKVQGTGRTGDCTWEFGQPEFTASSRARVTEISPTAKVLTSGKVSRASSLRTWPGGISRNRRQPNSVRTVVASCQRTPCAMLFAKSCDKASAVRKALPAMLPTRAKAQDHEGGERRGGVYGKRSTGRRKPGRVENAVQLRGDPAKRLAIGCGLGV